jgi:hypothetical protein
VGQVLSRGQRGGHSVDRDRLFFDDSVHQAFGTVSMEWESVYHSRWVARYLRLTALPAYGSEVDR